MTGDSLRNNLLHDLSWTAYVHFCENILLVLGRNFLRESILEVLGRINGLEICRGVIQLDGVNFTAREKVSRILLMHIILEISMLLW